MTSFLADRTNGIFPSKIREVTAKVNDYKKQGIHIYDFSIGRPDFDTPLAIKEVAKKALDDGKVHYTPSAGTREYQEAVCYRFHEDYQLDFEPDNVLATVGASEAIYAAMQGILNPGDEVLVPEPMYVYYGGLAFLAGGKVVGIPLSDAEGFVPTAEKIEQYITPKTKALLLTSPNNPTGQVICRAEVEKIAALAIRHNLIVIADDIYNKILYDGVDYLPIAKVPGMIERTIIIGSFSKTYAMDGWRIGYLIVPKSLYTGIFKMQQHIISCPCTFVQAAAAAALTGSQECVEEMVKEFDRRRCCIMQYLDQAKIPYVRPSGAFYIFPDMSEFKLSATDMAIYLLKEAHIAVVPGSAFSDSGENHIRIAFSTSYEEIDAGMKNMIAALERLRNAQ